MTAMWDELVEFMKEKMIGFTVIDFQYRPYIQEEYIAEFLEWPCDEDEYFPCLTMQNEKGERINVYIKRDNEGNGPGALDAQNYVDTDDVLRQLKVKQEEEDQCD